MTDADDARLERLEAHTKLSSKLFEDVYDRLGEITTRQDATNDRLDGLRQDTNDRLDRLIEATVRGNTASTERYVSQERRITSLEDRVTRLEE